MNLEEKRAALAKVQENIAAACDSTGRPSRSVRLIAVSKTKPWSDIEEFLSLGQVDFGENYVQESTSKIELSTKHHGKICWHFIGKLQSNKAKLVVNNFDFLHTLDSVSLATRLNRLCEESKKNLSCLIEVNISREQSKAGIDPDHLEKFLTEISTLSSISVNGLMCIPQAGKSETESRKTFASLRELMERQNSAGIYPRKLHELSMGMSHDYINAIKEGATMIRLGTVLFGER